MPRVVQIDEREQHDSFILESALADYRSRRPTEVIRVIEDACGLGTLYAPWACPNPNPCEKHKCWSCGVQATALCSAAEQLVCGVPQCADHDHLVEHQRRDRERRNA